MVNKAKPYKDYRIVFGSFTNLSNKDIQRISANVLKISNDLITIFYNENEKGTNIVGMLGPKAAESRVLNIGKFISDSAKHFGGGGGGRPDYGSGFAPKSKVTKEDIAKYIEKQLFT